MKRFKRWIVRRWWTCLDTDERAAILRPEIRTASPSELERLAHYLFAFMPSRTRKRVWHDVGLTLNEATDGTLDRGRTKEGNQTW